MLFMRMKSFCHPALIFAMWLTAVGVGLASLTVYKSTPGIDASSVSDWPIDSQLVRDAQRPTLLFFAHPRCPCTHSSLTELKAALAKTDGAISIRILCYQPRNADATWNSSGFQQSAARIHGVQIIVDRDGAEARRFGATTSGHTFIYGADGRLVFRGGVTGARGHIGANPGRTAVANLAGGRLAPAATPVYGCPLFPQ
jgi:hypothetical protein